MDNFPFSTIVGMWVIIVLPNLLFYAGVIFVAVWALKHFGIIHG